MRKLKEIFARVLSDENTLADLELLEIKFSQKTSAAIVYVNIDRKINPCEITEFVEKAKQEYNLKDFKLKCSCKTVQN